jgi:8-oxo-dGTP diphosphatase
MTVKEIKDALPSSSKQHFKFLSHWDPSEDGSLIPEVQVVSCFLQRDEEVLVLQRAKKDLQHNLWGIPGGKLDKGETPLLGLVRELQEETGWQVDPQSFSLLGTALSFTPSDGQYGLYVYHAYAPAHIDIQINEQEHHCFQWVSLEGFQQLNLLTAQREAFQLVQTNLEKLLNLHPEKRSH